MSQCTALGGDHDKDPSPICRLCNAPSMLLFRPEIKVQFLRTGGSLTYKLLVFSYS